MSFHCKVQQRGCNDDTGVCSCGCEGCKPVAKCPRHNVADWLRVDVCAPCVRELEGVRITFKMPVRSCDLHRDCEAWELELGSEAHHVYSGKPASEGRDGSGA